MHGNSPFFNLRRLTQLPMDVQEVRHAAEQVRDAEAVFAVLKALHTSCEQDLKLKRRHLFEWRCANRRSRERDPEKEELQRAISEAKELQEQAWQEFQSAWEDLQSAKRACLSTLMAYNSAKRCSEEQGESKVVVFGRQWEGSSECV